MAAGLGEGASKSSVCRRGAGTSGFRPSDDVWGNISAIDVLNLRKNEGEMYGGDLDVLFAGQ